MCSQWETKLPLPRFLCLLERWDLRMLSTDGFILLLLLLFKFILFFSDCRSEKSGDGSGDSGGGCYLDICWHLNAPSYVGVKGRGFGTIRDNCDDNDILVCNVCVHRVSRVRTLNTRWWGSGGHRGQLPRCRPHHHPLHCHSSHSCDHLKQNQQSLWLAVDIN